MLRYITFCCEILSMYIYSIYFLLSYITNCNEILSMCEEVAFLLIFVKLCEVLCTPMGI